MWHGGVILKLRCNGITGGLLHFFQNYLSNWYQRVFLNGQEFKRMPLKAGVPQGSVLGPLLFLIYINDLTDKISSDMRPCVSLQMILRYLPVSRKLPKRTTNWLRTWRREPVGLISGNMVFNPDITKQAIEVIFLCKDKKPVHPHLSFNGIPIARKPFTKHLGVYLDTRLNFSKHIKEQVATAMKG